MVAEKICCCNQASPLEEGLQLVATKFPLEPEEEMLIAESQTDASRTAANSAWSYGGTSNSDNYGDS